MGVTPSMSRADATIGLMISMLHDAWTRERDATPSPPVIQDARALVERLNYVAAQGAGASTDLTHFITIGPRAGHCTTPLDDLRPIHLRDMQTWRVHKGRYLLCRVVGIPRRAIAVDIAVEDQHGNALLLCINNMYGLFQAEPELMQGVFPLGQLLIIREPYMKGASQNPFSMLRLDSPSDVIFLTGSESIARNARWPSLLPPVPYSAVDALSLKAEGTRFFKQGLFLPAARVWSLAIEKDEYLPELFTNRALAYLSLKWFQPALNDAEHVLSTFPNSGVSSKALHRAAVALYGLGRYGEALDNFEQTEGAIAREWAQKCEKRIDEAEKGAYEWSEMYTASLAPNARLDVADFTGSVRVKRVEHRGGGRGLVAKRDIKLGQLLIVSKPFASVFKTEILKDEINRSINFATGTVIKTPRLALMWAVVAKLHGAPEQIDNICDLYAGTKLDTPTRYRNLPRGDVSLINPLISPIDLDTIRIPEVVEKNAFQLRMLGPYSASPPTPEEDDLDPHEDLALYTLPSLINHSCDSNAMVHWFGDVIVIRATSDIPKGDEITIPYRPYEAYPERSEGLSQRLEEHTCQCGLCLSDRLDLSSDRERRAALFKRFPLQFGLSTAEVPRIERQMTATYRLSDSSRSLRPELFWPLEHAQTAYLDLGSDESAGTKTSRVSLMWKSASYGFAALASVGYQSIDTSTARGPSSTRRILPFSKKAIGTNAVAHDSCIVVMLRLSSCFVLVGDYVTAERWFRAAWWVHDIVLGGRKQLFDARFRHLVEGWRFPQAFTGPLDRDYGWK